MAVVSSHGVPHLSQTDDLPPHTTYQQAPHHHHYPMGFDPGTGIITTLLHKYCIVESKLQLITNSNGYHCCHMNSLTPVRYFHC